jgi:hypothetical protein
MLELVAALVILVSTLALGDGVGTCMAGRRGHVRERRRARVAPHDR